MEAMCCHGGVLEHVSESNMHINSRAAKCHTSAITIGSYFQVKIHGLLHRSAVIAWPVANTTQAPANELIRYLISKYAYSENKFKEILAARPILYNRQQI